ncbi:MAG: pyridoxamine 5'-phosphate oxidase family protein [Acidimicrobiaceae bacterium]|nr:pyridoxamine 5'-phosphate oxidase family protein [Acidimicrobiaceae bacterium]
MSDASEAEELPRSRCLELLGSRSLGRLALSERALPTVVPVSYELVGDRVVLAAPQASRLLVEGQRPVVAFEVDDIDPDTFAGWSVVVVGAVQQIAADHPSVHTPAAGWTRLRPDPTTLVAGLTTDHISGRRFNGR